MQKLSDLSPEERLELGDKLRAMSDDDKREFISSLTKEQRYELLYDPLIWLRRDQYIPINTEKNVTLLCSGRGYGKSLSNTTPMLTANKGWITMGELEVGDYAYDEKGLPVKILGVYPQPPKEKIYKLTFNDKTTITSCSEHDWMTLNTDEKRVFYDNHYDGSRDYRYDVNWATTGIATKRTTQEIVDTFDDNHAIPSAFPLQFDNDQHHDITPYEFGNTFSGGVIPDEYIYCSIEQRQDFVRGFMDKYGVVQNHNNPKFITEDKDLQHSFAFLLRTLGEQPHCKIKKDKEGNELYTVRWRPCKFIPFTLKYKAKRTFVDKKLPFSNQGRLIMSYEEVPYEPTTCIEVDNDSHLFLAGEGLIPTHNTHTISRMLKWYIEEQGVKDFTIAAPSNNDLVQTIINGESGIIRSYADGDPRTPTYMPHYGVLKYPNGAVGRLVSSESPERARGGNNELIIADELGSFTGDALDFWQQLEYSLRKGVSQAIICTTPRATPLMIDLVKRAKDPNDNVRLITGSTLANADNLTPQMIARAKKTMNTRVGRQEVLGELILTNDKALFTPDLIEKTTVEMVGEFHRSKWVKFAIGLDPNSGTGRKDADEFGIVVAILTESNKAVIVENKTGHHTGDEAMRIVGALFDKYSKICSGKVRVEKNGAGAYVKSMLKRDFPFMPTEEFPSTSKKYSRIMAMAHLYETDIAYFDKDAILTGLTDEAITWDGSGKSPNHLDAACFALDGLVKTGNYVKKTKFII